MFCLKTGEQGIQDDHRGEHKYVKSLGEEAERKRVVFVGKLVGLVMLLDSLFIWDRIFKYAQNICNPTLLSSFFFYVCFFSYRRSVELARGGKKI